MHAIFYLIDYNVKTKTEALEIQIQILWHE